MAPWSCSYPELWALALFSVDVLRPSGNRFDESSTRFAFIHICSGVNRNVASLGKGQNGKQYRGHFQLEIRTSLLTRDIKSSRSSDARIYESVN